jgi:hypothetical protein
VGIWEQLNTKTLADLPTEDIQRQSNPIHLESDNEEILQSVKLLNDVTFRDGLPIPGSQVIVPVQATDSGTRVVIKQPNKGEVWRISAAQVTGLAGGSGSVIHQFYFGDGSNLINWYYISSTSSNLILNQESEWSGAAGPTFDENMTLEYAATRTSLTQSDVLVLLHRIR